MAANSFITRWRTTWFTPVNNSPLVTFRILFGIIMLMEFTGSIVSGWVHQVYIQAQFRFTFIDFTFLQHMHGPIMYTYFVIGCLMAILVILGLFYRPATILLALLWSAVYFSQKSHYNNHYYLMMLLSWIMAIMPANRRTSLDVKFGLAKPTNVCSRWCIQIFIIQIAIVYTYAAIAKMYPDWLQAAPVKIWFSGRSKTPYVGWLFANSAFAYIIAYSGILFDLLIVPALLWKRTRVLAVWCMLFFHFFNGSVFGIGVFPFLAMSMNVFFFPGSTFDNVLGLAKTPHIYKPTAPAKQSFIMATLGLYIIWQVLLPLRHHLYKGDVVFTEEGHRLSWRMMLRTKSGDAVFKIKDKNSSRVWTEYPKNHLLPYQANSVAGKPDFIWQFSKYLQQLYKEKGYDVSVYVDSKCSVNGRNRAHLIDNKVDIAAQEWKRFSHHDWVLTDYK